MFVHFIMYAQYNYTTNPVKVNMKSKYLKKVCKGIKKEYIFKLNKKVKNNVLITETNI